MGKKADKIVELEIALERMVSQKDSWKDRSNGHLQELAVLKEELEMLTRVNTTLLKELEEYRK